jgi:hypothetical protein
LTAAEQELVFSDEQLALLATLAGLPGFPAAVTPELDEAGWEAVAGGLLARGVLRDEDDYGDEVHDSDAVFGVVLSAPRSLWITIDYAPGAGESRQEILWLHGDVVVRQTRTPDGFHLFTTGDRNQLLLFQDSVLAFLDDGGADPPFECRTLPAAELEDALDLLDEEGPGAAAQQYPAAAGYVAAVDDARCIVSVDCSHRIGEDRIEGDGLTLVDSSAHGLWLARDEPWGESPAGDRMVVERVAPAAALRHVAALAEMIA